MQAECQEGTIGISIVVEDTGSGLTDAQLLRLFEPLSAANATTPMDLASGWHCRAGSQNEWAERLGAENKASKGSAFTFAFDAEPAAISPALELPITPLSILLVEDVSLNRRMIATMLRRDGHIVSEAEDGSTALELYEAGPFDLVLLDVGLPDMDGFQILEAMKRSASRQPGAIHHADCLNGVYDRRAGECHGRRHACSTSRFRASSCAPRYKPYSHCIPVRTCTLRSDSRKKYRI